MRCSHCNSRLAAHDLWCASCGRQTPLVKTELAAIPSLKRTWAKYSPFKGGNIPAAALAIILGIIPVAALVAIFHNFNMLYLDTVKNVGTLLLNLAILSVSLSIFVPFVLIAFKPVCEFEGYALGYRDYLAALKSYPRYLLFSLFSALYFVIIFLICFGFPNFGSDPILRLVWVVLVNYFIAVALPVPVLMERLKMNFWKAFWTSYKHFHVVRWNIYLLVLALLILNLAGFLLLILPLVVTLPLSWYAIRDYTDLLLRHEIIRDQV